MFACHVCGAGWNALHVASTRECHAALDLMLDALPAKIKLYLKRQGSGSGRAAKTARSTGGGDGSSSSSSEAPLAPESDLLTACLYHVGSKHYQGAALEAACSRRGWQVAPTQPKRFHGLQEEAEAERAAQESIEQQDSGS